jgi:hypothetical protein
MELRYDSQKTINDAQSARGMIVKRFFTFCIAAVLCWLPMAYTAAVAQPSSNNYIFGSELLAQNNAEQDELDQQDVEMPQDEKTDKEADEEHIVLTLLQNLSNDATSKPQQEKLGAAVIALQRLLLSDLRANVLSMCEELVIIQEQLYGRSARRALLAELQATEHTLLHENEQLGSRAIPDKVFTQFFSNIRGFITHYTPKKKLLTFRNIMIALGAVLVLTMLYNGAREIRQFYRWAKSQRTWRELQNGIQVWIWHFARRLPYRITNAVAEGFGRQAALPLTFGMSNKMGDALTTSVPGLCTALGYIPGATTALSTATLHPSLADKATEPTRAAARALFTGVKATATSPAKPLPSIKLPRNLETIQEGENKNESGENDA